MEIQHYKGGDILTYQKTLAQKKEKNKQIHVGTFLQLYDTHTQMLYALRWRGICSKENYFLRSRKSRSVSII